MIKKKRLKKGSILPKRDVSKRIIFIDFVFLDIIIIKNFIAFGKHFEN